MSPEDFLAMLKLDLKVAMALTTYTKGREGEFDSKIRARALTGQKYFLKASDVSLALNEISEDNDKECATYVANNNKRNAAEGGQQTQAQSKRKQSGNNGGNNGKSSPTKKDKWIDQTPCDTCGKGKDSHFHNDVMKGNQQVPCPKSSSHDKYAKGFKAVRQRNPNCLQPVTNTKK